jgi:hypothetical protein
VNSPLRKLSRWIIPLALIAPAPAFAQEMQKPSESGSGKSTEKEADAPKLYRFKAAKKGSLGSGPATVLVVEDMITLKPENLYVVGDDSSIKEAMSELEAGTPIEVKIERQKGKPVIKSLEKAKLVRGEERPDGFVFVGWDRKKAADGKMTMGIKLRKFGREVMAQIPLTQNRSTGDWNPSGRVDYVLGRVKEGDAVMAEITPGRPPILKDISEYYPPERGKFIALAEKEDNDVVSAAIKMTAGDGTELTIALPGVEQVRGKKRVRMPDAKLLEIVRRLKPDTEIEVQLRGQNDYTLHDINVVATPPDTKKKPSKAG